MKTFSSKRFTLIELLVVIAIIGILAGLVFPALGTVRNNARKSKASTECMSLKTAIVMYESEYSRWPADGTNDDLVKGKDYDGMCCALAGDNIKKMVFFEAGTGYDYDKEDNTYRFLDPWKKPYNVLLDFDYSGGIKSSVQFVKDFNSANGRSGDLRVPVAVYSFGDYNETDIKKLVNKKKLVTSW